MGYFVPRDAKGHYFWPRAGWLNYLAPPRAALVVPPDGAHALRLPKGGLSTVLCDQPFDVENARHRALAAAMDRALEPVQRSVA